MVQRNRPNAFAAPAAVIRDVSIDDGPAQCLVASITVVTDISEWS
jgi:hypothetical protein